MKMNMGLFLCGCAQDGQARFYANAEELEHERGMKIQLRACEGR